MVVRLLTMVSVFAQEQKPIKNGFSIGGAPKISSEKSGGYMEFGFGIFSNENIYLRNNISFGSGSFGSNNSYIEFSDSLVIGSSFPATEQLSIRYMSIVSLGFSMFAGEGKPSLTDGGFILAPALGAGIELLFNDKIAFFTEAVGTIEVVVGDGNADILYKKYPFGSSYATISFGGRYYF